MRLRLAKVIVPLDGQRFRGLLWCPAKQVVCERGFGPATGSCPRGGVIVALGDVSFTVTTLGRPKMFRVARGLAVSRGQGPHQSAPPLGCRDHGTAIGPQGGVLPPILT